LQLLVEALRLRGVLALGNVVSGRLQIGHDLSRRTAVLGVENRQLAEDGVALLATGMAEHLDSSGDTISNSEELSMVSLRQVSYGKMYR